MQSGVGWEDCKEADRCSRFDPQPEPGPGPGLEQIAISRSQMAQKSCRFERTPARDWRTQSGVERKDCTGPGGCSRLDPEPELVPELVPAVELQLLL